MSFVVHHKDLPLRHILRLRVLVRSPEFQKKMEETMKRFGKLKPGHCTCGGGK